MWLVVRVESGGEVDGGDAQEAGRYVAAMGNYFTRIRRIDE